MASEYSKKKALSGIMEDQVGISSYALTFTVPKKCLREHAILAAAGLKNKKGDSE